MSFHFFLTIIYPIRTYKDIQILNVFLHFQISIPHIKCQIENHIHAKKNVGCFSFLMNCLMGVNTFIYRCVS